ncbi:MAG: aldo/keto reductase [Succinivibrio sp.]|nr:aldo/keto reductase [Succinivibrio sp.]
MNTEEFIMLNRLAIEQELTTTLNNGVQMPMRGFGVFQITDERQCHDAVIAALNAGVRLIDTAACYGNERAVGQAIKDSDLLRDEIFLVSKVWIQDTGYENTLRSFQKTLKNLGTDYLDLYLIHMPYGDYHGSWRAMENLVNEGLVRAIGVCNFLPDRLLDLMLTHDITPAVNQIEMHPFCQQKRLRELMADWDVRPMAWAPLAKGRNGIFENATLRAAASAHGVSVAQVILRWLYQEGAVAIPKSVHPERIKENFDIEGFSLDKDDMDVIRCLDLWKPLILDVPSLDEVKRLHDITFEQ